MESPYSFLAQCGWQSCFSCFMNVHIKKMCIPVVDEIISGVAVFSTRFLLSF